MRWRTLQRIGLPSTKICPAQTMLFRSFDIFRLSQYSTCTFDRRLPPQIRPDHGVTLLSASLFQSQPTLPTSHRVSTILHPACFVSPLLFQAATYSTMTRSTFRKPRSAPSSCRSSPRQ